MKKIEVTSVSKSKKGTIWIQAKVIEGEALPVSGEQYKVYLDKFAPEEKEESDGADK